MWGGQAMQERAEEKKQEKIQQRQESTPPLASSPPCLFLGHLGISRFLNESSTLGSWTLNPKLSNLDTPPSKKPGPLTPKKSLPQFCSCKARGGGGGGKGGWVYVGLVGFRVQRANSDLGFGV